MQSRLLFVLLGLCFSACIHAQSDTLPSAVIGEKYLFKISSKARKLDQWLNRQSTKILNRLQRSEEQLRRKVSRKDSAAAKVLRQSAERYAQFGKQLGSTTSLQQYIPSLDTLSTSLRFLHTNLQFLGDAKNASEKIKLAMINVASLKSGFQKSEDVKQFIRERKQYLKERLSLLGLAKELKRFNKQAYYYSAKVNGYRQLLKDHKKAEQKALELLSKTKMFRDFMQKNSALASLFRLPGDPNTSSAPSLAGLQTRAQVNNLVHQQLAAGGPNAQAQFSQNMQEAQSKLNELKNKLSKLGNSSGGDLDMPEGFKPNNQRTKTFLQRIEFGANIQSQKSNSYFPVTSDIALTAGYKLNDNSIIGIGAGYKLGWGRNIRNIRITHEGVSLRSFVDIKLKGSFWITGGYEMNYREAFNRIDVLLDKSAWQESGLIGLSKVVDMRSKLLKKTKVQLLWDFLSYGKTPRPAAILLRIGYTF